MQDLQQPLNNSIGKHARKSPFNNKRKFEQTRQKGRPTAFLPSSEKLNQHSKQNSKIDKM
jgi:hypothetical protein